MADRTETGSEDAPAVGDAKATAGANSTRIGAVYRDLVAQYIHKHYARFGLVVYTEVPFGKTILGKDRRIDVLLVRESDQRALGIETKFQGSKGTTDEKIPYALQDVDAMWIPGCVCYGGTGWSSGVLHTLRASRIAVGFDTDAMLARTASTIELDHALASVFLIWTEVLPATRRLVRAAQLDLPTPRFGTVAAAAKIGRKPRRNAK